MQEYNWFTGTTIKVGIYGESHSPSIGVCLEGLAYDKLDQTALAAFMKRRAPGQNAWSTPRKEADEVVIDTLQNGLFKAHIMNTNIKPHDYSNLLITPRPGHADFTARLKYGDEFKSSGGGAFSGRLTAPLCIAGFLAMSYLAEKGIKINAHIKSIAGVKDESYNFDDRTNENEFLKKLETVPQKEFPVIDDAAGEQMKEKIAQARAQEDSVGGTIEVVIQGLPGGIGGPIFEGIEAKIAEICFAVPACKGVEFGNGFGAAELTASTNNDSFIYGVASRPFKDTIPGQVFEENLESSRSERLPEPVEGPLLKTNRCGGILGGISVGGTVAPIVFDVAVKPTPTISKEQATVNLETKENTTITVGGRHDPCIVPRAVPVYEAAAAIALADVLCSNMVLRQAQEPQGTQQPQETQEPQTSQEDLASLRAQIDQADEQLLAALAKRMEVAEKIGLLKKQEGKAVLDTSREEQKLESIYEKTDERSKPYIKDIYKALFAASRDLQSKL